MIHRALLLVMLVLLARPVSAQTSSVSVSAHLETVVDDQTTPFAPVNYNTDTAGSSLTIPPVTSHSSGPSGAADASTSGSVLAGRISAVLSSAATGSSPARAVLGRTFLDVNWFDTITVAGPPGSLVTLRATATFTETFAATPSPTDPHTCAPTVVSVVMTIDLGSAGQLRRSDGVGICSTREGLPTQTLTFDAYAGQVLVVSGSFHGNVDAHAGKVDPLGYFASSAASIDASHTMAFSLDVLTPGASYTTASGVSYASGAAVPPAPPVTALTLSGTSFRGGQTLTVGISVDNPVGQPEGDLYGGALLPDRSTVVFLSASGGLGGVAALAHPAAFVPIQVVPPGGTVNVPAFFRFTFPPGALLPPGTYTLFLALVRRGVLLDDRVDPADILAIDVKTLSFSP